MIRDIKTERSQAEIERLVDELFEDESDSEIDDSDVVPTVRLTAEEYRTLLERQVSEEFWSDKVWQEPITQRYVMEKEPWDNDEPVTPEELEVLNHVPVYGTLYSDLGTAEDSKAGLEWLREQKKKLVK